MPYEDPDPTDPMMLHGMAFETNDDQAIREMAACFIDEYLRLGFTPDRVLKVFQTKGYVGPHSAYQILGERAVVSMIDEYAKRWGPRLSKRILDRNANGDVMLPTLEQS